MLLPQELREHSVFEDNISGAILAVERRTDEVKHQYIEEFVNRLIKLLPKVGSDENKIIQIQVLVALSVEGILTTDNITQKAPMVKAICEMIKLDPEKKATAITIAKRLLH
jgi:hypothetical protein